MLDVLTTNGWDAMRWERLSRLDTRSGKWTVHVLDTSACTVDEVAEQILAWCRRALRGQAPQIGTVPRTSTLLRNEHV
jgi:hypothetical protein